MRVVLTRTACRQLDQIGRVIARDNPARAQSFIDELRTKAKEIGDFPNSFPPMTRYAGRVIRRRVFGNYLIFYEISDDRVVIRQFVHGARRDASIGEIEP